MSSAQTYSTSTELDATAAASDALAGMTLGRRERQHGSLRTIADITIAEVIEPVADLAIADRVAYVLARRTEHTHAVIAIAGTYLVVRIEPQLSGPDAHHITQAQGTPRIASIATPDGITPMLQPLQL